MVATLAPRQVISKDARRFQKTQNPPLKVVLDYRMASLNSSYSMQESVRKMVRTYHFVIFDPYKWYFGLRVYPEGSLVITLVCGSVCLCVRPSLDISETAHQFFLELCMKLGVNKVKKVTQTGFIKTLNPGLRSIKCQMLEFLDIFCKIAH